MARTPVPANTSDATNADATTGTTPDTASADIEAAASNEPDEPDSEAIGTIEARILLDQAAWRPNDVALLTPAEMRAGREAGWADDHPEAVAFARSLAA
ncbi:hypothetical protein GCM10022253_19500 [Sphingomonas endophytica]|uniref:Uncharacterized protein n=1 Tax=Sphingomonas endophytica TaxID=869719 RepID=A0ABR6NC69_9SPHN|nr:hypothetical protein [Sphingomonas endophytica]MBB5727317.1 hypothetical protein [Sphingomonas endophytica]